MRETKFKNHADLSILGQVRLESRIKAYAAKCGTRPFTATGNAVRRYFRYHYFFGKTHFYRRNTNNP